jgi:NAD(P)-dependent dehydrogenase (short-subunit alcohol dehydrogenase family)
MAEFYLDFEKPIAELRNKLRELSEISTAHPGDAMANCVKMLEQQLDETIRNTYPASEAFAVAVNVSNEDSVEAMMGEVARQCGGIDLVVANAGVVLA